MAKKKRKNKHLECNQKQVNKKKSNPIKNMLNWANVQNCFYQKFNDKLIKIKF